MKTKYQLFLYFFISTSAIAGGELEGVSLLSTGQHLFQWPAADQPQVDPLTSLANALRSADSSHLGATWKHAKVRWPSQEIPIPAKWSADDGLHQILGRSDGQHRVLPDRLKRSIQQTPTGNGGDENSENTTPSGGEQAQERNNSDTVHRKPDKRNNTPRDEERGDDRFPSQQSSDSTEDAPSYGFTYRVDHTLFDCEAERPLSKCAGLGRDLRRLRGAIQTGNIGALREQMQQPVELGLLTENECDTLLFPAAYQTNDGYRICSECWGEILTELMVLNDPASALGHRDRGCIRDIGSTPATCRDCQLGADQDNPEVPHLTLSKCEEHAALHNIFCSTCRQTIHVPEARSLQQSNDALIQHQQSGCIVSCPDCQQPIEGHEFSHHQSVCKQQALECPAEGCTFTSPPQELLQHMVTSSDTLHLQLPCLSCEQIIPANRYIIHYLGHKEQIQCPGCTERLYARELPGHLRQKHFAIYTDLNRIVMGTRHQLPDEWLFCVDLIRSDIFGDLGQSENMGLEFQTNIQADHDRIDAVDQRLTQHCENSQAQNQMLTTLSDIVHRLAGFSGDGPPSYWSATAGNNLPEILQTLRDQVDETRQQLATVRVDINKMDLRVECEAATSYDGTYTWVIDDVSARRRREQQGEISSYTSPPFHTSRSGYRISLKLYLDGEGAGKGTHISLFMSLMKGQYDALLKWPFSCKVTMALLDQSGGKQHISQSFLPPPENINFQRPQSTQNRACGAPKLASQSVLDDERYNKDDFIFIKCTVDTRKLKPL